MSSKKTKQVDYDERIVDMAATEVMHDAFMTYAEHVTLERALPRVEDGLKPVQRRILYTLHELGITPDKPYKKCARIVGEALGKFHPAGDASVYDAMVRMAQDFSMRMPLVDGHGNFGSIDGDPAAAMRYTEARMSPLALEMLRDLDKDTVPFRPNYDDTDMEPDLLPSRYPNLLVNGSSGIAVGLATNIPPHNLGEVIDAVILRMKKPDCALDDIMKVLPGPDFPTGAYLIPGNGLRLAYETGRGRIRLRAKTHFEHEKNGKTLIVVTEIPYELKKSAMLEKILQTAQAKKELFGGIEDVRDESDREGMRGIIECKKGVDAEQVLQLLYKHTDLQTTFGINMMAIAGRSPVQLSLLDMLDGYIDHQKNVVRRRVQFDLEKAEKREHILAGLIVAVENIDEVIRIIRAAASTDAAKKKLMETFELTGVQAQAILDMRLGRLTALEVKNLRAEHAQVLKEIAKLQAILASESELVALIRKELREIRKKYADERRTEILEGETGEIKIDESALLPAEDCVIIMTRGGGLKRMNPRAFQRSLETPDLEERFRVRTLIRATTRDKICFFSSTGALYAIPALSIPEARMREAGRTLASIAAGVEKDEIMLLALNERELAGAGQLLFVTEMGLAKAVSADVFTLRRIRNTATSLREGDRVAYIGVSDPRADHVLIVTSDGFAVRLAKTDLPVSGRTAYGVKGIRIVPGARVITAFQLPLPGQNFVAVTDRGFARRYSESAFRKATRASRGGKILSLGPLTGTVVAGAVDFDQPCMLTLGMKDGSIVQFASGDIPVDDIPGQPGAPTNLHTKGIVTSLTRDAVE